MEALPLGHANDNRGCDGALNPSRSAKGVTPSVGVVWTQFDGGEHGASVACPTTPMKFDCSFQLEPDESSAPKLESTQSELTATPPVADSTVSLLPANWSEPHWCGSSVTRPN